MKPARTFGLSLAILASAMLFSILPLMQVALVVAVRYRVQQVEMPLPDQSGSVTPMAVGGDFTGVDDTALDVQAIMGAVFLVIAFFAWRGRPRWIRLATLAAVLALTVVTIGFSLAPLLATPSLSQGIDSAASITRTLLSGRLVLSMLVAFYVVWYMNRGPARAFYRGYYLTDPNDPEAQAR